MNKLFLFPTLLLFSFLLITCTYDNSNSTDDRIITNPEYGEWQDREQMPINIELEQTFGKETEEQGIIFSSASEISGPVADSSNNIYLLDGERSKLMSFTEDGILRWETGSQGKGPGAFNDPGGLATDGSYLYLDNISGSRIDKYDMEGNFIRSFTWDDSDLNTIDLEGILPNGLLVTSSTLWGSLGTRIHILELSDKVSTVSQFDMNVAENLDLGEGLSSNVDVKVIDSLIATGNLNEYQIHFFDQNGDLVKMIQRTFDKLVRPGFYQSGGSRGIMDFGGLEAPVELGNGYLITSLSWPTNVDDPDQFAKTGSFRDIKSAHSVDLYNEDGTLLYSQEGEGSSTPKIGNISYVDPNGKVYIKTNDPYPQIQRYSLTIVE